jgi:hypothetical protein
MAAGAWGSPFQTNCALLHGRWPYSNAPTGLLTWPASAIFAAYMPSVK